MNPGQDLLAILHGHFRFHVLPGESRLIDLVIPIRQKIEQRYALHYEVFQPDGLTVIDDMRIHFEIDANIPRLERRRDRRIIDQVFSARG